MTAYDTAAAVLAAAASVDTRTPHPDPAIITMWAGILGNVNRADALQAVAQHYSNPAVERILPGDILAAVRKIRADRVRGVPVSALDPDDVDPEDVDAWLKARKARIRAIADGRLYPPQGQAPNVDGQRRVRAELAGLCGLPADVRYAFSQAEQTAVRKRAAIAERAEAAKAERRARVTAAEAELRIPGE